MSPPESALSVFPCARIELPGSRSRPGPCPDGGSGVRGCCTPRRSRFSELSSREFPAGPSPLPASEPRPVGSSRTPRRGAHSAERPACGRSAWSSSVNNRVGTTTNPASGKNEPLHGRPDEIRAVFHGSSILPEDRPRTGPCRAERVAMCFRGDPEDALVAVGCSRRRSRRASGCFPGPVRGVRGRTGTPGGPHGCRAGRPRPAVSRTAPPRPGRSEHDRVSATARPCRAPCTPSGGTRGPEPRSPCG
ncbi:hypothetical protein FHR84_001495 [Actinopolyspora biskrensis]|uniref:Uncharacterized protein n=1 Tax=Actinopolyspora biskrensis TaxID=1470178 RepID=A0A852Z7L8_9ACTN|nr:hypothetical protein [Actinopolyspora biskrensis]